MKSNITKLGILLIASLLFAVPAFADENDLIVDFETDPLFDQANFLPGEEVSRLVRVENNAGRPHRIIVEAINVDDLGGLSQNLVLKIEQGTETPYDDTLANFFDAGEVYLSDLSTSEDTHYNFSISFAAEAETPQGATLGFDILVGFQGTGGGVSPGQGSGPGGGGGWLPSGLTITYETDFYIGTSSAKITWLTSYKSTSRVIYGTQPGVFDLNDLPDYGYEFSTTEQDTPAETNGVVAHEVWLNNLLPNTAYYYRAISHASPPTIGREHSFTTLAVEQGAEGQEGGQESEGEEEQIQSGVGGIIEDIVSLAGSAIDLIAGTDLEADEADLDQELVSSEPTEDPSAEPSNLLAAIGSLTFDFKDWLIIIGVALLTLYLLKMIKKRKREKEIKG